MNRLLTISDDVDLREEFFGCICFRKRTGRVYQFNADATAVLKALQTQQSIGKLVETLPNFRADSLNDLLSFLIHCIEQGILLLSESTSPSKPFLSGRLPNASTNSLSAPLAVTIYITDRCPKACRHCITRSSPTVGIDGELTPMQWKDAFTRLRNAGVMQLIVTGGEPLIKEGIFEILEFANDLGFYISLLTDFDDMDERELKRLLQIPAIRYVQTSLDGANSKTHDYIRGQGSFEKTMVRLDLLSRFNVPYTISTSVYADNLEEVSGIASISKSKRAKYLYLNPLAPYGRAARFPREKLLSEGQLEQLARTYVDLIKNQGINPGNSYWQKLAILSDDEIDYKKPFAGVLDAVTIATSLCSLSSRGDIYLDSKLKAEGILKLGNILQDDFIDAWNSDALNALRRSFVYGEEVKLVHINVARSIEEVEKTKNERRTKTL